MFELTTDVGAHAPTFLALEWLTSEPYYAFVFGDDAATARALRERLLESGHAEFAPPAGSLLLVDGEPAGMVALLSPDLLRARRVATSLVAGRFPAVRGSAEIRERMRLAAQAGLHPTDTDAYLGRIAVLPQHAGRGAAQWLLDRVVEQSAAQGLERLVCDVVADNARALAFYARNGFTQFGDATVEGGADGRTLAYVHLARPLR